MRNGFLTAEMITYGNTFVKKEGHSLWGRLGKAGL